MRTRARTTVIAVLAALAGAGIMHAASLIPPADAGYAIGYDLGVETAGRLEADGVAYVAEDLIAGFRDAVLDAEPRLSTSARRQVLANIEREVAARIAERRQREDPVFAALVAANLDRSRAFHAAYGRRDGVVTLDGGTQYRVITAGNGPQPGAGATVVASYELRLIDGTAVAQEERRELEIQYLFPGAATVFRRMPAGSTWEIALPPAQALGVAGDPPLIGPNETLIATVTLHEVR